MESTVVKRTNSSYDNTFIRNHKVKRNSKKRIARKRIIISVLFIVIIMVAVLVFNHTVNAESDANSLYGCKGYMSIELHENDTLWKIAEKYAGGHYDSIYAYIDEVKSINGLTSNKIWAGEKIVIPVYSDQMSYVSNDSE